MVKVNQRLKASTLMESLIAMVIMVVCLGVATMIYTNVLSSDKQRNQLKAMFLANEEAGKTKAEKNFLDSEIQAGDWIIKKTVAKYEQTENLYKLSLTVLDRNKKIIVTRNELIPVE